MGSRFFPRLDGDDLCVGRDEIGEFLAECEVVGPHLNRLARHGGYDAGYVAQRFDNIVAAALRAKTENGGIVVW
ncbi:hypothetical protein ACR820_34630 [Streptomyces netropsis]